eukprot:GHVS01024984.1.p1 GENE.GHVS01024984.1~~GHVS01024984.1.p1  ORF type:complete len:109 (-),score=16.86 GHVS01024984.1:343-669(-)
MTGRTVCFRRFFAAAMAKDETGPVTNAIRSKLEQQLAPIKLNIVDESHLHKGHQAMKNLRSAETHFRVDVYSSKFEGLSLIQQHRLVYDILQQELKEGVHALSLNTKP